MESIKFKIEGIEPLLLNNPQTVDIFNPYSRAKKAITGKRSKTDEDHLEIRRLDVESKVYWDEKLGVYVPTTWLMAAIAGQSWARAKIKKAEIRSCVFPTEGRLKLSYSGEQKVKAIADISSNPEFIHTMLLKQGQVKLAKAAPIFRDWSFEGEIEFDSQIIDRSTLVSLLEYAASYNGFGDFRPTYGRSVFAEVESMKKVA